ncbi:MAG TPA: DUF3795 domain-containing protein [Prolixibacteraceae bacterium]|jgi:hypothetical protein
MDNKPTVNESPTRKSNSGKMIQEIKNDTLLIAYCGLYCGSCRKYLSGKCPSCQQLASAHWCKIRSCCIDKHIANCAECSLETPNDCKTFNNPISKVFKFIFGSDREKSILFIREKGAICYAGQMSETRQQSFKTKGRG